MTVGYLLDLLIINEVRKEKLADTIDNDIVEDLNKQNGFLLKEIGRYLTEVADGNRPGIFSKHKNYDKGVGEEENPNFIKVLYNLYQRHSELWDLEDERRDTENNADNECCNKEHYYSCVSVVSNSINFSIKVTQSS